jgi:hypothetical protein
MKLRSRLLAMRGEYWVYLLAGIVSSTTLMTLYLHDKPTGLLRLW